jgi:hypothetical protein
VEQAQCWVERPLKVPEEQKLAMHGVYGHVLSATYIVNIVYSNVRPRFMSTVKHAPFYVNKRLFLWPYRFQCLGLDLPLSKYRSADRPLHGRFHGSLSRDISRWLKPKTLAVSNVRLARIGRSLLFEHTRRAPRIFLCSALIVGKLERKQNLFVNIL